MGHTVAQHQGDGGTAVVGAFGFIVPQPPAEFTGGQQADLGTTRQQLQAPRAKPASTAPWPGPWPAWVS